MKHYNIIVLFVALFFLGACEKEENKDADKLIETTITESKGEKNTKSGGLIQMVRYTHHVLFLDQSDNELFFLQIGPTASVIPSPSPSANNAYIGNNGATLYIESPDGTFEYGFIDNVIIGIGHIEYQSGLDDGLLLLENGQVSLRPNDPNHILNVKCACFTTRNIPTNCTSGGHGATSCSVTSGGSGCSISCQYSTPCCSEYNSFTYN